MNINDMNNNHDDRHRDGSDKDFYHHSNDHLHANYDHQNDDQAHSQRGGQVDSEKSRFSTGLTGSDDHNNYQDHQSYVYPHSGYNHSSNRPGGSNNKSQPPHKKNTARIIGFIAWTLALVVLFSAASGSLVYHYMRNQIQPVQEPGSQTDVTETDLEEDETQNDRFEEQTAEPDNSGMEADSGVRDRHFSLGSAAARRDGDEEPLSIVEIADKGKPAVVAITTEVTVRDFFGQEGIVPAAGSGFLISDDGYIVTNNHVVENASAITIFLDNGDLHDAKLVGADPQNDIAVLKIDGSSFPAVVLGDSSDIMVGELAVAIGNPLGQLSGSVTAGIISGLDRQIRIEGQTLNLLQTDAAINQGNSGGALFNSFGEVIGINTAKSAGAGIEGLGFAIPINHAKPIIESIIQSGYVTGRPKIGVSTQDLTAQMADYYDLVEGVYIVSVERNSAADRAGMRRGDIIIKSNGIETLTTAEINDIKNELEPGDEMVLTVIRDGNEIEITVILDEDVPHDVMPATNRSMPADNNVI